jgi:hypothetical protein
MAAKLSLRHALKAMWSRMQLPTKLLLMLGILAVLVGSLAWEEDTCGAERVLMLAYYPPEIFQKMSVDEVEANNITTITVDGNETTLPFGFINDKWEELKRQYEKGDCLFHYQIVCGVLCGSEGYLLIRNSEVIYFLQTRIS